MQFTVPYLRFFPKSTCGQQLAQGSKMTTFEREGREYRFTFAKVRQRT